MTLQVESGTRKTLLVFRPITMYFNNPMELRSMKTNLFILAVVAAMFSTSIAAESLYGELPSKINADEKYVFYSHGFIVEGDDETPVHPEYGMYDFPAIRQALFQTGGFNLIAHHRPKNTDVDEYVPMLESWVLALIDAGVDASDITLIGFSRGSRITAITSSRLRAFEINTVLMASCIDGDISADPPLVLGGQLLSIYETTDTPGECGKLAARSDLNTFDEIMLTTGKSHGAFYTAQGYWLDPIREWLARQL